MDRQGKAPRAAQPAGREYRPRPVRALDRDRLFSFYDWRARHERHPRARHARCDHLPVGERDHRSGTHRDHQRHLREPLQARPCERYLGGAVIDAGRVMGPVGARASGAARGHFDAEVGGQDARQSGGRDGAWWPPSRRDDGQRAADEQTAGGRRRLSADDRPLSERRPADRWRCTSWEDGVVDWAAGAPGRTCTARAIPVAGARRRRPGSGLAAGERVHLPRAVSVAHALSRPQRDRARAARRRRSRRRRARARRRLRRAGTCGWAAAACRTPWQPGPTAR